ncbi:MAG: hypothetical protein AB7G93_05560 [Bdellovibrionales bacterium]
MRTLVVFSFFVLVTTLPIARADGRPQPPDDAPSEDCRQLLLFGEDEMRSLDPYSTFEVETRRRFEEIDIQADEDEGRKIEDARDRLAELVNRNSEGFVTFAAGRAAGQQIHLRAQLRLGQAAPVEKWIRKEVREFRALYHELERQAALREEVLEEFFAASLTMRPTLEGVVRQISQNRLQISREMGRRIWSYYAIVSTLLEEAGLQPRRGLMLSGMDRDLQVGVERAVEMAVESAAMRSLEAGIFVNEPPPAQTRSETSRQTAREVLKKMNLIDISGTSETSPSLDDVRSLFSSSPAMQLAQIEAEYEMEEQQQRILKRLRYLSDQQLMSLLAKGLNAVTLGKFESFFGEAKKAMDQGLQFRVHRDLILEFVDLADRLSNDENGNLQLAQALLGLLGRDSTFLSSLALTIEGIEPLKRVKTVPLIEQTIWGPNNQSLSNHITTLEGLRATQRVISVVHYRQSHFALALIASSTVVYAGYVYWGPLVQLGTNSYANILDLIMGFP